MNNLRFDQGYKCVKMCKKEFQYSNDIEIQ